MQKSIYTQQHQRLRELLTDARNAADLTQVEVARRLGILPEAGPRDMKGPETVQ